MGSYDYGKQEVCAWIRSKFLPGSTILDVGAGDGKWRRLLPDYTKMDAVEVFAGHLPELTQYRKAYHADIRDYKFDWYDLVIFGDIIEHLAVGQAQAVLQYAMPRCRDMIVAVPFLYPQGTEYGNEFEIHIQDDLTAELFAERYPDLDVLIDPGHSYCYYHKRGGSA